MAKQREYPPQDRANRTKVDVPMSLRLHDLVEKDAKKNGRSLAGMIRVILWEHYTGEIPGDDLNGY